MDKIGQALDMIMNKLREEEGEDFEFEEGDEVVAVYNDGVIFVGLEDRELKVRVVAGEPMKFDFNLDLLEKKVSEE